MPEYKRREKYKKQAGLGVEDTTYETLGECCRIKVPLFCRVRYISTNDSIGGTSAEGSSYFIDRAMNPSKPKDQPFHLTTSLYVVRNSAKTTLQNT